MIAAFDMMNLRVSARAMSHMLGESEDGSAWLGTEAQEAQEVGRVGVPEDEARTRYDSSKKTRV